LFKILFISRFYTSVATARSGPLQGLYKTWTERLLPKFPTSAA
jgi:hypothetical protein